MRTAKTDQTGRMPRLIWVCAGRTCHFVGFCHEAAHIKLFDGSQLSERNENQLSSMLYPESTLKDQKKLDTRKKLLQLS